MTMSRRPLPFVLCASNHGSMIVNHKDYRMVGVNEGYGMGYQLLELASFDPEEVSIFLQLLAFRRKHFGDGVVAIDCGANVGVHTIEWARHMFGWGSVVAMEAQERLYYALAGNVAINNCFNARALHVAVGAKAGVMKIPRPNYNQSSSFGSLELRKADSNEFIGQTIDYSDTNCDEVRIQPIDGLQLNRVDCIKIDVEGMELEVLAGAEKTIKKHKPYLLVEIIKTDKSKLEEILLAERYKIFPSGINILAIHESDPIVDQISIH